MALALVLLPLMRRLSQAHKNSETAEHNPQTVVLQ